MNPQQDKATPEEKKKRREVVVDISRKVLSRDKDVMKSSLLMYPWLTRHMVNGCMRRMKNNIKKYGSNEISTTTGHNLRSVKYGRPKGTTIQSNLKLEEKFCIAKDKISRTRPV